jgi:hypothetical protein
MTANGGITVPSGQTLTVAGAIALNGDTIQTSEIANNAVTNAIIRQSAARSVVGNSTNATANVADISATASSDAVLRESSGTIGFGTVATAGIADSAVTTAKITNSNVTYAKIQNVSATDMLLGRSSAGGGVVEEIACTAAGRALLDDANAAAQRTTLGLTESATTVNADLLLLKDQVHGFTIFNCPVNNGNSLSGVVTGVTSSSTALNTGTSAALEVFLPLLGWSKVNVGGVFYARPSSGTWTVLIIRSAALEYVFCCRRTA